MSASLSLSNQELTRATLMVMGYNRDVAELDEAMEADLRAVIRAGLRRFFTPIDNGVQYQWRFLQRHASVSAEAKYSTGTIEVTGGTVTLSGGTWPTDVTNWFIKVAGHTLFPTVRDSGTVLTIAHDQLAVAAGTSYEASKFRYALPSDFSEWIGRVVYQSDGGSVDALTNDARYLKHASEADLMLRYSVGYENVGVAETTHYAVTYVPSGTPQISFWPVPLPDAFVHGTYLSEPEDQLAADLRSPGETPVVQVAAKYAEAVLECVLAAAESYNDDGEGIHEKRAQLALASAIAHDRASTGFIEFDKYQRGRHSTRFYNYPSSIDFSAQTGG